MKLSEFTAAFAQALKEHIHPTEYEVLTNNWDPTYGQQDPRVETLELFSLDELYMAIDKFGEELREKGE